MKRISWTTWVAAALCLLALAVGFGWRAWNIAHQPKVEPTAPAIVQVDGSVVLQRDPIVKPLPHKIPKGAKVERQITVTVQPVERKAEKTESQNKPENVGLNGQGVDDQIALIHDCPPVTVDMSLVRMPDQTRRVVASSPDGQVIAGLDIPVESVVPPTHKWAAGIAGTSNGAAAWVTRDIGRVRLIAIQSAVQPRPGQGLQPNTFVGAGITF